MHDDGTLYVFFSVETHCLCVPIKLISSKQCQVSNWKGGDGKVGHKYSCAGKCMMLYNSFSCTSLVQYILESNPCIVYLMKKKTIPKPTKELVKT